MLIDQEIANFREGLSWPDRMVQSARLELLDTSADKRITDSVINDIERISHIVGLRRILIEEISHHLFALAKMKNSSPRVAEICCGNGWVLRALDEHLSRLGVDAELMGLDINERSLQTAASRSLGRQIQWERADALALPMPAQSIDLIINVQSLHHFVPRQVVQIMQEVARVARRAYFFDLRRTLYGWLIVKALRPIASSEFIHDASLSHRRAYKAEELRMIARAAAVKAQIGHLTSIGLQAVIDGARS